MRIRDKSQISRAGLYCTLSERTLRGSELVKRPVSEPLGPNETSRSPDPTHLIDAVRRRIDHRAISRDGAMSALGIGRFTSSSQRAAPAM
jgi:hypothetical protein